MPVEQFAFTIAGELAAGAVAKIESFYREAIGARGKFTLALPGGSSPVAALKLLGTSISIDWNRTFIFWGDDRFVPHDHAYSNYRMARESFIDGIAIPAANIFPIPVDDTGGEACARAYEEEIRNFFGGSDPVFDLVMLGMGKDGHTASLFPGDDAVTETEKLCRYVPVPGMEPLVPRITMTLPLINAARHILFIVNAEGKETVLEAALSGDTAYPAARVIARETTTWMIFR